jgi:hypothetical protein
MCYIKHKVFTACGHVTSDNNICNSTQTEEAQGQWRFLFCCFSSRKANKSCRSSDLAEKTDDLCGRCKEAEDFDVRMMETPELVLPHPSLAPLPERFHPILPRLYIPLAIGRRQAVSGRPPASKTKTEHTTQLAQLGVSEGFFNIDL